MASCHGLGARHGTFCPISTLTVIPLQLMAITGKGLVCQGLKSKLIWLHSHSEPQTQICHSSESVKRPPEAWSGHMQRRHSLSIRLLSILWQINLEPKQRRAFDIPSPQRYMRRMISWRFHHSLDQPLHPDWMNERCKTVAVDMVQQGTGWRVTATAQTLAGDSRSQDSRRTLEQFETDGFFFFSEKSLGICSHSETQPRRRVIK